jgi:hypothetical protein
MTTQIIIDRASTAHEESPIAVFKRHVAGLTYIECVFANTYDTKRRIKFNDVNLIGVYDRNTDPRDIKKSLKGIAQ